MQLIDKIVFHLRYLKVYAQIAKMSIFERKFKPTGGKYFAWDFSLYSRENGFKKGTNDLFEEIDLKVISFGEFRLILVICEQKIHSFDVLLLLAEKAFPAWKPLEIAKVSVTLAESGKISLNSALLLNSNDTNDCEASANLSNISTVLEGEIKSVCRSYFYQFYDLLEKGKLDNENDKPISRRIESFHNLTNGKWEN